MSNAIKRGTGEDMGLCLKRHGTDGEKGNEHFGAKIGVRGVSLVVTTTLQRRGFV